MGRLLSFRGRLGRIGYIGHILLLIMLFILIAVVTAFLVPVKPIAFIIIFTAALLINVSVSCLTVQRLHDMNLSGWFYWLLLVPPIVLHFVNPEFDALMEAGRYTEIGSVEWVMVALCALFTLVLLLWAGTDGENKYDEHY